MASPHGADAPFPRTALRLVLPDIALALESETGLFSHRAIDAGTHVLLRYGPKPPDRGDVLDLGCGYGPIALVLALRAPDARVWAVDVDERALELTEQNVRRAGLPNIVVCTPRAVPDPVRFNAIYSNPPIRIGKRALRSLLLHWLARLEPGGRASLVIKRAAGADSLARWLSERQLPTTTAVAKRGYRVLDVRPSSECNSASDVG